MIEPLTQTESGRSRVYKQLYKAIVNGDIKPNERIVEATYAELLQVSRTPVREALHMLEKEGLVVYEPKKGVSVRGVLTEEEVYELYEVRQSIQALTVDSTVDHITDAELKQLDGLNQACLAALQNGDKEAVLENHAEFNRLLVLCCKKPLVIRLLFQLENSSPLVAFVYSHLDRIKVPNTTAVQGAERLEASVQEHIELYQALALRDRDAFRKALDNHIIQSRNASLRGVQELINRESIQ